MDYFEQGFYDEISKTAGWNRLIGKTMQNVGSSIAVGQYGKALSHAGQGARVGLRYFNRKAIRPLKSYVEGIYKATKKGDVL